jgi:protein-S-isoprenylcysteine O-methyltransferase Ste14
MSALLIAKYGALIYLFCIGVWFATAQSHFDRSSRARPLLLAVLLLSATLSIATIYLVIRAHVPTSRLVLTVAIATTTALVFRWALRSIAQHDLGLAFSGIVPAQVVENGPYRYVRHPLYTSYSVFWATCAFLAHSYFVGGLAVAIVLLYVFAAKTEERDIMRSPLAPTYSSYRQRTGLLFPRIIRKH